ncbi:MAG: hypothetical protein H6618_00005, partial [Deltaproteobacteria bacterium]|nr:hypothetical protein [Deltaproteobacteria bacterium]
KFQMSLEKEPLTAKQYYIDVKLGEGTLTVGRASLPYAGIMGAADILTFGVDVPAGASYSSNSPLVSYNTGAMFGPVAVHAALAQASNPGNKAVKTTPVPAIDLAVKVDVSGFRGGLAVHTEETYYSDVTSGDLKPIRPMTFAVHAGYSHDMVHADLSYGTGDPLFTGVTSMAMMDKDLKDKMNSMMFNVGVDLDALSATLFYGNEVAKLSKDYGHMNKKQEIKDVEESATSMGLRLVHAWEGVDWLFEISNTEQKYDSVTFRNRWYAGLGLSTSFNS